MNDFTWLRYTLPHTAWYELDDAQQNLRENRFEINARRLATVAHEP